MVEKLGTGNSYDFPRRRDISKHYITKTLQRSIKVKYEFKNKAIFTKDI